MLQSLSPGFVTQNVGGCSMISIYTRRVRKDGSIGLTVDMRCKTGIAPGTYVTVSWDSEKGIGTIEPETRECGGCKRSFKSLDNDLGLCPDCMQEVESLIKKGYSLRKAVQKLYTGKFLVTRTRKGSR